MSATPLRRQDDSVSRWVGFRLGGQLYALPILRVQEVLSEAVIEPVPGTSALVCGVINLRGNVVTVIDLRLRLGIDAAPAATEGKIVVIEHQDESIGLCVDGMAEVRKVVDAAIRPAPNVGSSTVTDPIRGVYLRDGEMVTLLDPDIVVEAAAYLA